MTSVIRELGEMFGLHRLALEDALTYALLDSIIDHYFPVVESYGEQLDTLDDDLINSRGDASIPGVFVQRYGSNHLPAR